MASQVDPHRTLGVPPAASLNEIRSAYRRLVKQYHPDAAGERALPRFLAIQAAYEQLVDGEGRLRPGSGPGAGDGTEPWRADAARARATREAWRARRATWGATDHGGPPGATARPSAGGSADRPKPGDRRTHGDGPGDGRRGHARETRRATPGSTTYDEAREHPRNPTWTGAAWYGAASGTYWTINPREYADPRKHGPEYQARARRAAAQAGGRNDDPAWEPAEGRRGARPGAPIFGDREPPGEPSGDGEPPGGGRAAPRTEAGSSGSGTSGTSFTWGTGDWSYAPGTAPGGVHATGGTAGPAGGHRSAAPTAGTGETPPLPDLEALLRRLAPGRLRAVAERPGLRGRLLVALAAWPPLGYGGAALVDLLTGCGPGSATCPPPLELGGAIVQPVVLGLLILAPALAAPAAFAALAALGVALPLAVVLAIGGATREPEASARVLAIGVLVAYGAALTAAALQTARGAVIDPREGSDGDQRDGGPSPDGLG